jgi:hypothetical protein
MTAIVDPDPVGHLQRGWWVDSLIERSSGILLLERDCKW